MSLFVDTENLPEFSVRRYALKFDPPTLVIEYVKHSSETKYVRKIKFKKTKTRDSRALAQKVMLNNSDILSADHVDIDQLIDLISLLFNDDIQNDSGGESSFEKSGDEKNPVPVKNTVVFRPVSKLSDEDIIHEDLNSVPDEINYRAKSLMNIDFEKNRIKPGDNGYEYDRRVDFTEQTESNEWDDDDEEEEEE